MKKMRRTKMNKELIKKYKAEFDWWLDGGYLLFKQHDGSDWYDKDTYEWNHVGTYIINDKYVEYSKALAEGKTILIVNDDSPHGDIGIKEAKCREDLVSVHERHLRIKPDEPFKVGDYVVYTDSNSSSITQVKDSDESVGMYKHFKLWTLEDASDAEWVYILHGNFAHLTQISQQENLAETAKCGAFRIVPAIGQTPKQLGLEK